MCNMSKLGCRLSCCNKETQTQWLGDNRFSSVTVQTVSVLGVRSTVVWLCHITRSFHLWIQDHCSRYAGQEMGQEVHPHSFLGSWPGSGTKFARAAMTKCHRIGGLSNRSWFFLISGDQMSQVKALAWLVPVQGCAQGINYRALSSACRYTSSLTSLHHFPSMLLCPSLLLLWDTRHIE